MAFLNRRHNMKKVFRKAPYRRFLHNRNALNDIFACCRMYFKHFMECDKKYRANIHSNAGRILYNTQHLKNDIRRRKNKNRYYLGELK